MKFNENGPKQLFNIDLDGTLTKGPAFWEGTPQVDEAMADAVRNLYAEGNYIIIWTARQWWHAPETAGWLTANRIPYHGLKMEKGGSGCYVDDKAMTPEQFLREHT